MSTIRWGDREGMGPVLSARFGEKFFMYAVSTHCDFEPAGAASNAEATLRDGEWCAAPVENRPFLYNAALDDPNTMPRLQLSIDACLLLRAHR
jgi:hypothetical protein